MVCIMATADIIVVIRFLLHSSQFKDFCAGQLFELPFYAAHSCSIAIVKRIQQFAVSILRQLLESIGTFVNET